MPGLRLLLLLPLALLMSCQMVTRAPAPGWQLERMDIVSRSPAFGGTVFEGGGAYETVVAIAHMRIDPRHPANRDIADIDKAPTAGGWVRYKADVVILRPRDAANASRVLLVELPNRGRKLFPQMVNDASGMLATAADAGNGFTMRRGHTMAWIGWQGNIALSGDGTLAGTDFPIAASAIVGASVEESVFNNHEPEGSMVLSYPAASLDQSGATLTVRPNARAPHTVVPAASWSFKGPSQIGFVRPRGFDAGAIYQFTYQARDPKIMGLGMAAVRDITRFLRHAPDSPLADIRPDATIAVGVSQSGRFLRDLIWQGFNADMVFDGAMPLIAGSRKSFVNVRFAQPGRYSTQHLDHLAYGDRFPFSYAVTKDPVSGRSDGIFARCQRTRSCPKLMHVDSSLEFWQGRASLVVTDGAGSDIALPANVRAYLMSSTQHMAASRSIAGFCKYASNTAQQGPAVRALLDRLVDWVRSGKEPPDSRFPRMADSMLTPFERGAAGFPDLRGIGVDYPGVINELDGYQVHVPMVDADGIDIAGIRLPDVAAPLASHTGWNVRRRGYAEGELCDLTGASIPFSATPRAGDPRLSISQRYPTRIAYAKAVALAARELRDQGLLLQEDVDRYIERARIDQRVNP